MCLRRVDSESPEVIQSSRVTAILQILSLPVAGARHFNTRAQLLQMKGGLMPIIFTGPRTAELKQIESAACMDQKAGEAI
jgi:hypothetical protein